MLEVFDDLIEKVHSLDGSRFRELQNPVKLPMRTGLHANRRVVLQSDTAVELGGSKVGSCAFTLATSNVSLVRDGRVALLGSDVSALPPGDPVPFVQAILVAGEQVDARCLGSIESCQQVKDYIDGYMMRSMPGQVWARISRDLLSKAFGFAELGGALMRLVKETEPNVECVEVLFVTSLTGELDEYRAVCSEALRRSHEVRKSIWLERGIDIDCPYGGHCGSCGLKDTCTEIRKMKKIRDMKGKCAYV